MDKADFWTSVKDIIEDGFTLEGLQKLDYYAELFIRGKLIYKRFSPNERYGCSAGGTTHVIASIIAGAENSQIQSLRGETVIKENSNLQR